MESQDQRAKTRGVARRMTSESTATVGPPKPANGDAAAFYDVMDRKIAFAGRLGLLAATLVGIALLTFVCVSAVQDTAVVIEPIQVSSSLKNEGISEQVLAARIQDKLVQMQRSVPSLRPPDSYENNWNDRIRIQIPRTSISIEDVTDLARRYFTHETRIGGEATYSNGRLHLTVRVHGLAAGSFPELPPAPMAGQRAIDETIDQAVTQAAVFIFSATQPYRYAVYLDDPLAGANREEARRVVKGAVERSPKGMEGAWLNALWSAFLVEDGDLYGARTKAVEALNLSGDRLVIAAAILADIESVIGTVERETYYRRLTLRLLASPARRQLVGHGAQLLATEESGRLASLRHDETSASQAFARLDAEGDAKMYHVAYTPDRNICALARGHELAKAGAAFSVMNDGRGPLVDKQSAKLCLLVEAGRWSDVAALAGEQDYDVALGDRRLRAEVLSRSFEPWIDLARAEVAPLTPPLVQTIHPDCYQCLVAGGRAAFARHDFVSARRNYAAAIQSAPSLADAYFYRAQFYDALGNDREAIADLRKALQLAPNWVDPIELFGEVVSKRSPELAVGFFYSASLKAPHWPRLHYAWSQALSRTGDVRGAMLHRAVARCLDADIDKLMNWVTDSDQDLAPESATAAACARWTRSASA